MTSDPTPLAPSVWWAHTSDVDKRLMFLLDEEERTRNARFRNQADRDRHLLGRSMARLALAELAGCPPEKVTFDLRCRSCEDKERTGAQGVDPTPHGKPHPSGPARGLEISISHSGDWVALAVSEEVPVGIDVERISDARDLEGLADYTLAEAEREVWRALAPADRAGAFFGYWARKEAMLKATGLGLSGGLRRLTVSPPHSPARLLSWEGGGGPDTAWLCDLDRGAAYRSALAVLTERPVQALVRTPKDTAALLRSWTA